MPDGGAPAPTPDVDGARPRRRRGARRAAHGRRCAAPSSIVANVDGHAARLSQRVRRLRRRPRRRARSAATSSPARAAGARFDLPRAGRALGAERPQLEPVPLLGRAARAGEGGAGPRERTAAPAARRMRTSSRGLRRLARPRRPGAAVGRPATRAATSAARGCPRTTATCCTSTSAGSSAPASRAARCAPARTTCARPGRGRCASTDFDLSDELWAQFQIPIGLAFFLVSERRRAASSRCTRARPARPSASSTSRRGTSSWRANPVLADLEPDVEALIVNRLADPHAARDRADRPLLRARGHDQGAAGRGSPAATPSQNAVEALLRAACASSAERRVSGEPERGVAAGRRIAPRVPRSHDVDRGCRDAAAPDAVVRARRDRDLGPRGLHHRAHGADQHRPGPPQLRRRDARERSSSCSARPSAGRRPRRASLWPQVEHARAELHGRDRRSRCPCPAPTTSSSRRPSTSTALADGEVPLSFHFTGSVLLPRRRRAAADRAHPVDLLGATGACRSRPGAR